MTKIRGASNSEDRRSFALEETFKHIEAVRNGNPSNFGRIIRSIDGCWLIPGTPQHMEFLIRSPVMLEGTNLVRVAHGTWTQIKKEAKDVEHAYQTPTGLKTIENLMEWFLKAGN